MSGTDPDIEILETDASPPPYGTPPEFRELVALALKTTAVNVLDASTSHDKRGAVSSAPGDEGPRAWDAGGEAPSLTRRRPEPS
jgi:hypothetical protein